MKASPQHRLVLITAPDLKSARALAKAALTRRLAACVNLVPGIESHYHWQGTIERSREVLLILKTTARRLRELEALTLKEHPYDTPEFLVLSVTAGAQKYLAWLSANVSNPPGP